MATTSEIVNWVIKSQANGYNRAADVLPIINDVHKLFYKHEQAQVVITDPATGALPKLTTTRDVFNYDAPVLPPFATNEPNQVAWRIAGVYLRGPISRDYNTYDYQFTEPPVTNTTEYQEWLGNYYYKYQFVRTFDATTDNLSRLCFSRQPGDTTDKFHLLMYRKPREITSDRIQLQIPDSDGAHRLYFFPAVMKLIEAQNHGNYDEAIQYIEEIAKPKIWKVMNSGAQGRRHKTKARYF